MRRSSWWDGDSRSKAARTATCISSSSSCSSSGRVPASRSPRLSRGSVRWRRPCQAESLVPRGRGHPPRQLLRFADRVEPLVEAEERGGEDVVAVVGRQAEARHGAPHDALQPLDQRLPGGRVAARARSTSSTKSGRMARIVGTLRDRWRSHGLEVVWVVIVGSSRVRHVSSGVQQRACHRSPDTQDRTELEPLKIPCIQRRPPTSVGGERQSWRDWTPAGSAPPRPPPGRAERTGWIPTVRIPGPGAASGPSEVDDLLGPGDDLVDVVGPGAGRQVLPAVVAAR